MADPSTHDPHSSIDDQPHRAKAFLHTVLFDDAHMWADEDQAAMLAQQLAATANLTVRHLPTLKSIKSRMKRVITGRAQGVPDEVARALYYVVIAQARTLTDAHISELSPAQLQSGLQWTLKRSWVASNPQLLQALSDLAAKIKTH